MRKDYYIYLVENTYKMTTHENLVPAHKIAAKVSLTRHELAHIHSKFGRKRQELLEHYYDGNQKLVTG